MYSRLLNFIAHYFVHINTKLMYRYGYYIDKAMWLTIVLITIRVTIYMVCVSLWLYVFINDLHNIDEANRGYQ